MCECDRIPDLWGGLPGAIVAGAGGVMLVGDPGGGPGGSRAGGPVGGSGGGPGKKLYHSFPL